MLYTIPALAIAFMQYTGILLFIIRYLIITYKHKTNNSRRTTERVAKPHIYRWKVYRWMLYERTARHIMLVITVIWFPLHILRLVSNYAPLCQKLNSFRSICFILSRIALFTVMFARVKVVHSSLRYKTCRLTSIILLILILLNIGSFGFYMTSKYPVNSCIQHFKSSIVIAYWINVLADTLLCICLLILFAVPLKEHMNKVRKAGAKRENVHNEERIQRVMMCCILAILSSCIHDIVSGYGKFDIGPIYTQIAHIVYSTGMALNAILLLFVLSIWPQIFLFRSIEKEAQSFNGSAP